MCKSGSNGNYVEHYFNDGKNTDILNANEPSVGLSEYSIVIINSLLTCKFRRLKRIADAKAIENYFDLSIPYYLLAAEGKLDTGFFFKLNLNNNRRK